MAGFTKGGLFFGAYNCFCGCSRYIAVSVIDEDSNGLPQSSVNDDWAKFKKDHPTRKLFLLQPGGNPANLRLPTNGWNPNGSGPIAVARDTGNDETKSDWYDIINLSTLLTSGFKISLFVDNSGSMTEETVRASLNYFKSKLATHVLQDGTPYPVTVENGRLFIANNGEERYIVPHLKCE